ncbi:hypothetical protein [Streptomyces sp. NPDC026673]|uniref:hypothetical protein n=1 Tax=Streptomyces sp. NPDC026673 TaxID=3155724 RepID=UPI00340058F6
MRIAVMVSQAAPVVPGTWAALVLGLASVALLPTRVQYYAISPLTMVLWLLAMVLVPPVACVVLRGWIGHVPGMPPPGKRLPGDPGGPAAP